MQFARLRWRMLRGALRSPGGQRWTIIIGTFASVFVGVAGAVGLAVAGRLSSDPASMFVIAPTLISVSVVAVGVVAGISQPVDPRVLATEPLTDRQLGIGLLTASALGPPGLAGALLGLGLLVGAVRGASSIPIVALTAAAFMLTLLLLSRSTINALGLFATRFPRAGQIVVGVSGLTFYGGFQFLPRLAGDLDANQQQRIASALEFLPPGQLGRALDAAGDEPVVALIHLVLGSAWLLPLAAIFVWTTKRLIVSVDRAAATDAAARRVGQPTPSGALAGATPVRHRCRRVRRMARAAHPTSHTSECTRDVHRRWGRAGDRARSGAAPRRRGRRRRAGRWSSAAGRAVHGGQLFRF